mmetsp:Transcript_12028/g.22665  ORF Transcript_12028/g.22665 Transcript_12028/m.22665 type:complete len:123 (-) Transcript_12028:73-441(-)
MGKAVSTMQQTCCPVTFREDGCEALRSGWSGEPLPMLLGTVGIEQDWVQHRVLPNRLEVVPEERDAEESAEKENVIEVHSSGETPLKSGGSSAGGSERQQEPELPPKREPLRLPIAGRRRHP